MSSLLRSLIFLSNVAYRFAPRAIRSYYLPGYSNLEQLQDE
ncbi:MAG TPA: hypothetical protein VK879_23330 [Candidatus Sulfomarinibacteraceae bacterium]|nr:hypothetical protein [Candidatus Sulfomarinibacteraceae bacterium]